MPALVPVPDHDDAVRADEAVRRRLVSELEALERQVGLLETQFTDFVEASELVATDDEHDPEGHTIAFERQQVAALLRDARRRRDAIVHALERVDDGRYGRCSACGRPIGPERLDALPGADLCIHCAV